MAPSECFTPLHNLSLVGGPVHVIGVVVDFMPPAPTRGTDWQCTFNLADERSPLEGQRVKLFVKDQTKIPPILGTGDIVILRNIQLKHYRGSNILLSNFQTQWTVFHCCDIPREHPAEGETELPYYSLKDVAKPSIKDMAYAVDLCNIKDRSEWNSKAPNPDEKNADIAPVQIGQLREKFSLIERIGANQFFDIVGQVVKMFPVNDRMDMYVTDYTENSLLFNYNSNETDQFTGQEGDEYGYLQQNKKKPWTGPSGKYTLTVTLFWPHAAWAGTKVREGDFVLLQNVHIKIGRDGSCRLEGVLHTDQNFPERVNILKVGPGNDERVKDLLRRKKQFLRTQANGDIDTMAPSTSKRPRDEDRPKHITKQTLKRQRHRQREAELKNAGKNAIKETEVEHRSELLVRQRAALQENPHIACMHSEKPCRTVAAINRLDNTHVYNISIGKPFILPFQNLKFRTKIRVIDYAPARLEEFAVRASEFDCLEGEDSDSFNSRESSAQPPSLTNSSRSHSLPPDSDDGDEEQRKRWTWCFTLFVEDASDIGKKTAHDRMAIHVADENADFLLNMTASNLKRREDMVEQLREKLFILWGDLEERKMAAIEATTEPKSSMAIGIDSQEETKRSAASFRDLGVAKKQLSSKPFICCVEEYGIKRNGKWLRRFGMFGTSIQ